MISSLTGATTSLSKLGAQAAHLEIENAFKVDDDIFTTVETAAPNGALKAAMNDTTLSMCGSLATINGIRTQI